VTRDVDGNHLFQAEVPLKIRLDEWSDKATTSCINVDCFVIDPKQAVDLVDENTIGICAILGTTYTGEYEDTEVPLKIRLDEWSDKATTSCINVDWAVDITLH
jgi:hypothetical protein